MDHWVPSYSPSSSYSGAAPASSTLRSRFGAVWRSCGRCAAAALAAAGWALGAMLTCVFAVVGSLVGIFIGACMGMSTESGMLRGAGVEQSPAPSSLLRLLNPASKFGDPVNPENIASSLCLTSSLASSVGELYGRKSVQHCSVLCRAR
ncbi:hypothetical protein ACQ4PT_053038 [Festuca glaucescens]